MYSDFNLKYGIEQFGLPLPCQLAAGPAPALPQVIRPMSLEDADIDPTSSLGQPLMLGDDPDRPIGGENSRYPSRSEAVWAACCAMARRGASEEVIAGILLNPIHGISASVLERRDAKAYAWRQALRATTASAVVFPFLTKRGDGRPSYGNALAGLNGMDVQFRRDLFKQTTTADGEAIQEHAGEITDDVTTMIRKRFYDTYGFDPYITNIEHAVQTLALENSYNSMRDYFDERIWDKVPRLPKLFNRYFGAEDTELNSAFGTKMMVAAVRRVRRPGAKYDTMVVLEGSQGSGKSTALKVLAGEENFSDQPIIGLDAKTQGELLSGVLIFEIAELSGIRKAETTHVKAFLSRDTDRYRPAYGRRAVQAKRQTIFVGTTNDDTYLMDVTGNRRFWPVATGNINLEGLKRDRDQLWAEAAHLEAVGEDITLPETLWAAAAILQSSRMPRDAWLDVLASPVGARVINEKWRITTQSLLGQDNLNIPPGHQNDWIPKRLKRVMNELGWDGPEPFKMDKKTHRGYSRPFDPETDDKPVDF